MIKQTAYCGKIAVKKNTTNVATNQLDVITRLFEESKLAVSCLGCKGSLVQIQSRRPIFSNNSSKQFEELREDHAEMCGLFLLPVYAVNGKYKTQWETAIAVNCGTAIPIGVLSNSSDQYSKTLNTNSVVSKSSLCGGVERHAVWAGLRMSHKNPSEVPGVEQDLNRKRLISAFVKSQAGQSPVRTFN